MQPLPSTLQKITRLGIELGAVVNVAEYPAELPALTESGPVTATVKLLETEIDAEALLVVSATLVARTATVVSAGRIAGAVYIPSVLIVPTDVFPPGISFTLQVTVVFAELLTAAAKGCCAPSITDTAVGATVTAISAGGGCGELEPTSPPQPWSDATNSSAMRQSDWVPVRVRRARRFVHGCIAAASARVVPVWCMERNCEPGPDQRMRGRLDFTAEEFANDLCSEACLELTARSNGRGGVALLFRETSERHGIVPVWETKSGTVIQFGAGQPLA